MVYKIQSVDKKKIFVCLLIFLVLIGGLIVWLWLSVNCKTEHSTTIDSKQIVNHLPVEQTEVKPQLSKPKIKSKRVENEKVSNDKLTPFENLPLPSPFDEEVQFTLHKPGSLTYQVDRYVEDEAKLVKQISDESFSETLLNMSDWNSNYYKLVIQDAEPNPAHPSCLKLIIYSRRFAKLVEHGHEGLTKKEILSIVKQLKLDLAQWRSLWAEGQRIRANETILHSPQKRPDELIVPLTLGINATMLLTGAFSIEEALPLVIESVETLGDDTNWAVVGYACDKILNSLDYKKLSAEQQRIVDEYRVWQTKQESKIFEYKIVELPSFKSSMRPFERATSLGADLDFSKGKIDIEIPYQYPYVTLSQGKGYYDPTGNSEVLRKIIRFAKAYSKTKL